MFLLLKKKRRKKRKKASQNGRHKSISHPHACPSPSILYSPQTRLNLPPTMSGQRTGRQGRTACRHPRTLAEHAVHVRAFRATQTPTRGCCQCKGTAQKGRVGSPQSDYKPEMHLFMETGADCLSAGPHHCGPIDPLAATQSKKDMHICSDHYTDSRL